MVHSGGGGGKLKVMYTNIDGLLSGMLELRDYLIEKKPDVVCVTETKLREEVQISFKDQGYNVWRRDRKGKAGGGVLIIVRDNIYIEEIEYGENAAEIASITIRTNGRERRKIIVTYIPPKTNTWGLAEHQEMQREVLTSLGNMLRRDKKILLLGDFNCKNINWEVMEVCENGGQWGEELLQMAMVNTLDQWTNEYTRFRGEEEPAMLDLVFTKKPEPRPVITHLSPFGKSDHVVMEVELENWTEMKCNEEHRKGRVNHAKSNFDGLSKFFDSIEWKASMANKTAQEKYDFFLEKYHEGVHKYVPLYKVRESKHAWFNARCVAAKKERNAAWRKLRKQRNERNRKQYIEARNEYVRIRREEERRFERDIVKRCEEEPRLFYRYINGKMSCKETIDKLIEGDNVYETAQEMSEIMNESFKSVFTLEENFEEPNFEVQQQGISNIVVQKQKINNLLEKLDVRKAMGPDGVSAWTLRECREQLVEPIWYVINSSLKEGRVPKQWKRANIVPIYKGGKKTEPQNYRPVSLTSVVGKICEIVIKEKWVEYLEKNAIINDCQFGFRQERSCVTNLLSFYTRVIDEVQGRDGWVDTVFLDIKKAFDTVPHKRLLWKMEHIGGIRGNILKWMRDYLEEREMRTVIRDTSSNWSKVTSGVPQGSVLAPIMFQVYINDIHEGVTSYMNLFADDAKLLKIINNKEDCLALQRDIDKIWEWSKKWKLEFNAKKCHVMEMGKSKRRPTFDYKMGRETIVKRREERDLGVVVQDTLSPEKHINGIFASTYRTLANIRVAFSYMDTNMMKKIITSMIRPKIEYAAVIWSPYKKKDIRKLERIQRAATKMVPELRDCTYEERLKEMGLPTLENRRERGDLITMYKIVNHMEKIDRQDLVTLKEAGGRETRGHSRKIRKSQCLRNIKRFSFPHRTVDTWNGLSEEIVTADNVHIFKDKLDKCRYGDRSL